MYTFNIVALAPIFFSLPKSLAYPSNALDTKTFPGTSARGQLFRRLGSNDGSSENNAIEIFLESTAGWPAIAEGDCYAILCLGEPRILQRQEVGENRRANYRDSGAGSKPFKKPKVKMYEIGIVNGIPAPDYTSAEEYPFASSKQGGEGSVIFPVPVKEQQHQGGAINTAFEKYQVEPGEWYRIAGTDGTGRYCNALRKNDISVCIPDQNDKGKGNAYDAAMNVYKSLGKTKGKYYFGLMNSPSGALRREEDKPKPFTYNETFFQEPPVDTAIGSGEPEMPETTKRPVILLA